MGYNAPEWHLSNVAAVVAGGIATGVYPTNSSEAVNYVLEHSRADILVVGDSENLAKLSDTGTKLAAVVQYEEEHVGPGAVSLRRLLDRGLCS